MIRNKWSKISQLRAEKNFLPDSGKRLVTNSVETLKHGDLTLNLEIGDKLKYPIFYLFFLSGRGHVVSIKSTFMQYNSLWI